MTVIHETSLRRAKEILTERTCRYLIPDGQRLLAESRRALRNVLHCGMAWRLTGEPRYHERVIKELDAACALRNWNPRHFLDTAEMAAAVALGYDWLFHTLSGAQKKRYEDALISKALKARPLQYGKSPWWFREAQSNWSQVCSAGLFLAASAISDRDPALADSVFKETRAMLAECHQLYSPDGGYAEGPGYWHYGTHYQVMGLAGSITTDHPLPPSPLLERSGDFILQLNGPTGLNFNFADGRASRNWPSPAQSWIASTFENERQAVAIRNELSRRLRELKTDARSPGSSFPLHLLWLPPPAPKSTTFPLTGFFTGTQPVAMARSGWTRDSAWIALKGGTGAVSHGHLDAGSFVYEAGGVRWFHDLGADNYNLPGYFHGDRWQYFRLQNRSHNTLVIDDRLQLAPEKGCPLTPWQREGDQFTTTSDLSPAYRGQARRVLRSAVFHQATGQVTIKDEIESPVGPIRWAVVTTARIEIKGNIVTLVEDGKRLILKSEGGMAPWQEFSLKPENPREHQNEAYRMVGFITPPAKEVTLKVTWVPE